MNKMEVSYGAKGPTVIIFLLLIVVASLCVAVYWRDQANMYDDMLSRYQNGFPVHGRTIKLYIIPEDGRATKFTGHFLAPARQDSSDGNKEVFFREEKEAK